MIELSRWSVVVPTCRPESYAEFVEAWTPLFDKHDVDLIPVWDIDGKRDPDIPDFIPTGTDMIRSWGIFKAWESKSQYTITLDDDVLPYPNLDIFEEYERQFDRGAVCSPYLSVGALTTCDYEMRGFPYSDRKKSKVAVQYGGWGGVLDFDAATQVSMQPGSMHGFSARVIPVPRGVPVTTCIMNAAWRTEYAPIMWQLPLLDGKYNRFGDIWSGLFQKKVLDMLGDVMLINGRAQVRHERASDPIRSLERELPGIEINEYLWGYINFVPSFSTTSQWPPTILDFYRLVTNRIEGVFPTDYYNHFIKSRDAWLELFV